MAETPSAPSANPFELLTDAELERMTDRAYREAARDWRDVRLAIGHAAPDLVKILRNSAQSASDYWNMLRAERARRDMALSGRKGN